MRDMVLSPPRALAVGSIILALTVCDVALATLSWRQRSFIVGRQNAGLPKEGDLITSIRGERLNTQKPWIISPPGTQHLVILVFRESCVYCEKNWKNWDYLFENGQQLPPPVIFVTSDKSISEAYLQKHPLLTKHITLLGVEPNGLGQLNLGITPQTLLASLGRVDHDWSGVLDADTLKEIQGDILHFRI